MIGGPARGRTSSITNGRERAAAEAKRYAAAVGSKSVRQLIDGMKGYEGSELVLRAAAGGGEGGGGGGVGGGGQRSRCAADRRSNAPKRGRSISGTVNDLTTYSRGTRPSRHDPRRVPRGRDGRLNESCLGLAASYGGYVYCRNDQGGGGGGGFEVSARGAVGLRVAAGAHPVGRLAELGRSFMGARGRRRAPGRAGSRRAGGRAGLHPSRRRPSGRTGPSPFVCSKQA